MPVEIEKLANILGQDTLKKIYEDAASRPIQEGSKALTDLVKVLRLFTAPIQLLAAYQDRLTKYLDKVRNNVKDENQIEAPASLSGPIIERLKYLEDENYLTDLYLNLLTRAIDKERVNEAHPAFYHIIDQLSADEAMILYIVSQEPIYYDYTWDVFLNKEKNVYQSRNKLITKDTIPRESITFTNHFDMYISHLESLNLIKWPLSDTPIRDEKGKQTGIQVNTKIHLTEFGKLFVKACIPEKGFIIVK